MIRIVERLLILVSLTALAIATTSASATAQETAAEGPIAYVGHGALFDANGREIKVTEEFLMRAQDFYMRDLRRFVPQRTIELSTKLNEDVLKSARTVGLTRQDAQLMANSASLDLLLNRAPAGVARDVHVKLLAIEFQRRKLARRKQLPSFFELEGFEQPLIRREFPVLQPMKKAPRQALPFDQRKGQGKLVPGQPLRRTDSRVLTPAQPSTAGTVQPSLKEQPRAASKVRPEFLKTLDPAITEVLAPNLFENGGSNIALIALKTAATNSGGQDYRDQCAAAGVPIPPDWGVMKEDGQDGWESQGTLTNEFISQSEVAEVFTWESDHPEGMCIALPRWDGDVAGLLGIICLSKNWSTACFWDNQKNGSQFEPRRGEVWPLSEFGGGTDLTDTIGGICTSCHAGQNPYVLHPGTNLGSPKLASLPIFSDDWYKPIVKSYWPQNPGPLTESNVCTGCHSETGEAGAFPIINSTLSGYCGILGTSIGDFDPDVLPTMPKGAPGSQKNHPDVADLKDMCSDPPPDDGIVIGGPTGSLPTGVSGFGTETNVTVTRSNDGSMQRVWGTRQYADVTATANAYCAGLGKSAAQNWQASDCGEDESSYMRYNPDTNQWESKSSGSANNEPGLCRYPLLSSVSCVN